MTCSLVELHLHISQATVVLECSTTITDIATERKGILYLCVGILMFPQLCVGVL